MVAVSARPSDAAEVVVIGAGAAGCLLAAELAEAGREVRVLEAGPDWKLHDLASSQVAARRLKWAGPVPELAGSHRVYHNFNSGWGVGGAALHHAAVWIRFQPDDFRMATLHGRGLDWPLEYADLRADYDAIQKEVGISGDARAEVWRPPADPYPLPPLPVFSQGRLLAAGFQRSGIRTAPVPTAIVSTRYKDRPGCLFDGWCDAGCPTGALANPLVTSLKRARRAGVRFQPHSYVARIVLDGSGRRASGVEYVDAAGARNTVLARTVVLAAYAVQNSLILLNSASGGLANRSGLLGRYFNAHTMVGHYGLFADETECHLGTTGAQLFSQDGQPKDRGNGRPFGSYQWQLAPAMKPNDLLGIGNTRPELHGRALTGFLTQASRHLASMNALLEGEPSLENRVELSGRRDRNGIPLARISHSLSANGVALAQLARQEGAAVMAAAGARSSWTAPFGFSHLSGGTIMGADPSRSVCDRDGRTHDVSNLYVAGASLFPANGSANPTYTVHALARRTARAIQAAA